MDVLGVDLSLTHTGLASTHDTSCLKPPGDLRGMWRIDYLACQILERARHADLVAIEGYSYASHGRSTVSLAELGGIVRYGLWCEGIIYIDVPPSTLKKYATGKGNADKGAMLVAAVKRLGYEGTDNNEADARWLHAVGMALMGKPVANVPELHRNALGALGTERLDAMLGAKPDDAA